MTTARIEILLLICCMTALAIAFSPVLSWADEDQELEEILDGFDDREDAGDDLQEVIEGFDDTQKDDAAQKEDTPDDLSEEEILEGFDEESTAKALVGSRKPQLPPFLNLDGYLKLSSAYNLHSHKAEGTDTNWGGLSSLKTELKLELDAKLPASWQARIAGHAFYDWAFQINGRSEYEDEVLDQYEKEIELEEAWLMGSLTPNLDIKTGRQIEVWGRSDNIRITDVLNPLNLRVPGMTDIENLRLPVTMTKLEYFFAGLNLFGIAIHELRFSKNPKFGSDFFSAPSPLPGRDSDKGLTIDDTQYAVALNGIFHRWDASLYGAYIFDDFAYFDVAASGFPPRRERKYARIKMVGGAGNIACGNWLFIAEAAFFDNLRFTNTPGKKYSRLDGLVGLEYSGFRNTTLAVDIANQHIFDFDNVLKEEPDWQREDLFQSAVRLTRTCLNDTLTLTFLANTFGATGNHGAVQRFTVQYDLTDSIEITGGAVFYHSGDLRRTRSIGSNDRLYFNVQYNF
jgi:hypothetical protein